MALDHPRGDSDNSNFDSGGLHGVMRGVWGLLQRARLVYPKEKEMTKHYCDKCGTETKPEKLTNFGHRYFVSGRVTADNVSSLGFHSICEICEKCVTELLDYLKKKTK